jgi:cell division protein FtsI (penicillin-binding protein 3)
VADQIAQPWRRTMRSRIAVAAIGFALWTVGIEARLVYLQVFRRADLQARADRQQMRTIAAPAKRGEILDRHGRVLAYSVDADSIYAVPTDIAHPQRAAAALCAALDTCTSRERQALAERLGRQKAFAYVRRQVSPDEAKRVAALDLEGVGFIKENRRFYPNKELAAHLLGYVGIDSVGLAGLEAAYDSQIRGRSGTVLIQTDARRHAFSRLERPPTAGATLELTIDQYLQHVAERELRQAVWENQAIGGTAMIMNPQTGEIFALANEPTFNPNAFRATQENERRNRAVQDIYEPGSTFKVITASAALEEGIAGLEDPIDVSAGLIRFGARQIDDVHRYDALSFTDVIVKSSNVGAIKIGLQLGPERLGRYVRRFGFGEPLSPDFPGESPGIVWDPARLDDSALASVSMGYQVGVTALQMATAVSSVANGGELVEPRVVRAIVRGNRRVEVRRRVLRRTVSPGTAAALTTIMESVVERGTAQAAHMSGYTIAGKTGTAAKLIDGRYSRSDYNASFVGFVPSRKPAVTILVVIDSPHGAGRYGGTVAAPVFKRIAEATLRHLGVGPTLYPAPPVLVTRRQALELPAVPTSGPAIVTLAGQSAGPSAVPDLRGLSARDALRALARIGLTARLTGDGHVVGQDPPPGSPAERGTSCQLVLDRQPTRAPVVGYQP